MNPKSGETATAGSKEPGEQDVEREAAGWLRGGPAINHALLALAVRDNYALKPKKKSTHARKAFLPPSQVPVLRTSDLRPPKEDTRNPA